VDVSRSGRLVVPTNPPQGAKLSFADGGDDVGCPAVHADCTFGRGRREHEPANDCRARPSTPWTCHGSDFARAASTARPTTRSTAKRLDATITSQILGVLPVAPASNQVSGPGSARVPSTPRDVTVMHIQPNASSKGRKS
jgi:hypothetical protein